MKLSKKTFKELVKFREFSLQTLCTWVLLFLTLFTLVSQNCNRIYSLISNFMVTFDVVLKFDVKKQNTFLVETILLQTS